MHLASHQVKSTGSKWLQKAPNYYKWFQMSMAEANAIQSLFSITMTLAFDADICACSHTALSNFNKKTANSRLSTLITQQK